MDEAVLATWLRAVELEPGSERQSAIARAATDAVTGLSTPDVIDIVDLAHGARNEDGFKLVHDGIRQIDPTFGCVIDDLETRLAASVFVAEALDQGSATSVAAAQGVLSARWSGFVGPIPALATSAEQALAARSEAVRRRPAIELSVEQIELPEYPEDGGAITHQDGNQLVEAIDNVVVSLSEAINEANKKVADRLATSDEELEVLWWAYSGYSDTGDKPWSRITNDGLVAITMGAELAGKLRFPVEPLATRAILSRLLGARTDHAVTLSTSVSAASGKVELLRPTRGNRLLPVLSSMAECHALDGRRAWVESVSRWSINPSRETTCLELACQTTREVLLAKQLS